MKITRNKLNQIILLSLGGVILSESVRAQNIPEFTVEFPGNNLPSGIDGISGNFYSRPSAVSTDGQSFISQSITEDGGRTRSYVSVLSSGEWTTTRLLGGTEDLDALATSISSDGKYITGFVLTPEAVKLLSAGVWHGDRWNTFTTLTDPEENILFSLTNSLSGDALVAGGLYRKDVNSIPLAAIWSGPDWNEVSRPASGLLYNKAITASEVNALSRDGSVAAGASRFSSGPTEPYLTIWTGEKWQRAVYPEQQPAFVGALSGDGNVLAGNVYSSGITSFDGSPLYTGSIPHTRAAIYHGVDWSTKTLLSSIGGEDHTYSSLNALSSDGTVAGGSSQASNGRIRATLWSGPDWSAITDLGVSLPEETYLSSVKSLSGDGSVAVGQVQDTSEQNTGRIVLWKLKWDKPVTDQNTASSEQNPSDKVNPAPAPAPAPGQAPETGVDSSRPEVVMVDVASTQKTIGKLSSDAVNLLQLQYESLKRLTDFCSPDEGMTCWDLKTGYRGGDSMREVNTGFSLSSSITPSIDAGFSLDQSLDRSLPDSFSQSETNSGAGLFVKYHQKTQDGEWFVMPAVAFNRFKTDVRRHKLADTEAATGKTDVRGLSYSIMAGKNYRTPDEKALGWYTGLRRDEIKMDGWNEANSEFPLRWNRTSYKRTDMVIGLKSAVPVLPKLSWVSAAEMSQRISGGEIRTSAENTWLGNYDNRSSTAKNMWNVSSGLAYQLTNDVQITAMPSVWKTSQEKTAFGASLGVRGQF